MAKIKVFVSFEFDGDWEQYRRFCGEAKSCRSDHKIEDNSLQETYKPHDDKAWLKKARRLISQSDIVIVVTGQDTHNAPGVEKEVGIANEQDKQIFQIRPKNSTGGAVRGVRDEIPWKWKHINAKISECLKNLKK